MFTKKLFQNFSLFSRTSKVSQLLLGAVLLLDFFAFEFIKAVIRPRKINSSQKQFVTNVWYFVINFEGKFAQLLLECGGNLPLNLKWVIRLLCEKAISHENSFSSPQFWKKTVFMKLAFRWNSSTLWMKCKNGISDLKAQIFIDSIRIFSFHENTSEIGDFKVLFN